MKKNLLFTAILLLTAFFAYSQIVVQSTSAYSVKEKRPSYYRGDAELTFTIGDGDYRGVGYGFTFNTSHGVQINRKIWVGGLFGYSFVSNEKFEWLNGRADIQRRFNIEIHFAPKLKINLWNEPRHSWMPYLSVATGISISDYFGFFGDFKAGFTHYNRKRSFGISPCIGLSILGGRDTYIPYGNVGVNIEFGGTKAFNK